MITLPAAAKIAIGILEARGYEAFAVGGCVRDLGLGKIPYDIDITTNALPDEIEAAFLGYKIIGYGKKHGTITVIISGTPVEITTYRIDGKYIDHRRPDSVSFTSSLKMDLSRRDFTMNAICYNDRAGLIDLFDGVADIENRIIRPIGNPKDRFTEDSLRILRAFRFMSQLNFSIPPEVCGDIRECAPLLKELPAERIIGELSKLLLGDNPSETLKLMNALGVMPDVITSVDGEMLSAIDRSKQILPIRLAILLSDFGEDLGEAYQKADSILKKLHFDNHTTKQALNLIRSRDIEIIDDDVYIKQMLRTHSCEGYIQIIEYLSAFRLDKKAEIQNTLAIINRIIGNAECYLTNDLKISGDVLIRLGVREGPDVRIVLDRLLQVVYRNSKLNNRKELIKIAKSVIREIYGE